MFNVNLFQACTADFFFFGAGAPGTWNGMEWKFYLSTGMEDFHAGPGYKVRNNTLANLLYKKELEGMKIKSNE